MVKTRITDILLIVLIFLILIGCLFFTIYGVVNYISQETSYTQEELQTCIEKKTMITSSFAQQCMRELSNVTSEKIINCVENKKSISNLREMCSNQLLNKSD